ncbi:hypothetical protein ABH963_004014 [Bacillus sp. RC55]
MEKSFKQIKNGHISSENKKEHISNLLRREYTQFLKTHHRKPRKYEHDEILHEVMIQMQKREIWILYGEVKRYYLSEIGKWFRKIESEWESHISNSEKQQV